MSVAMKNCSVLHLAGTLIKSQASHRAIYKKTKFSKQTIPQTYMVFFCTYKVGSCIDPIAVLADGERVQDRILQSPMRVLHVCNLGRETDTYNSEKSMLFKMTALAHKAECKHIETKTCNFSTRVAVSCSSTIARIRIRPAPRNEQPKCQHR